MSAVLEEIKSEIAKLAEVVKDHKNDRGTIDEKALAAVVQGLVDKQVAEKLADAERNRPRLRGEIIGPPASVQVPGYGRVPGFGVPSKGTVESGKFAGHTVDDVLFTNWLLSKAHKMQPDKVKPPTKELTDVVEKALDATTAGRGDEYVPTGMQAQLWMDMFLASKIVDAIGVIPMPTDPFDIPLGWGAITWRKGGVNTATTASDPATAKSTLTSTEQVAEVDMAYDLNEDGVIATLPTLRTEIARSGAEQMDNFLLNADNTDATTGNINMDDANPPDDSYFLGLGQDGLRHLALVDNTAQKSDMAGVLTDAGMRVFLALLGKYGADVSRLLLVVDAQTYVGSMLGLANVATLEKYGPNATILTGELLRYAGIPVIVSASMHRTAADGKVDTADNGTKGQIVAVHRDMWKVGFRRELTIEIDRDIRKRQFVLVASFREAMVARGTRSSATHTSLLYNIT